MDAFVTQRIGLALGALATLGAVAAVAHAPVTDVPMILIPQDVTSMNVPVRIGETIERHDVFVIRDGSIVSVLGKATPGTGSTLVYCPRERMFVSPEDQALFDRDGEYVQGPGTGDMSSYRVKLDTTAAVIRVGEPRQRPRSRGEISGEAGEAYVNWRADPDTPQGFCQDPVR